MTMMKVAEQAGVSYSTVSRVINGLVPGDSLTARNVKKAMKEIGYVPPPPSSRRGPHPKSATGTHTGNVGVLLFGVTLQLAQNMTASSVIHAVETRLAEKGLNLVLGSCDDMKTIPMLAGKGKVDGLILFAADKYPSKEIMEKIRSFPVTWVFTSDVEWGDHVRPDNDWIARHATAYFLKKEIRHVAYLSSSHSSLAFQKRLLFFKEYMEKGGGKVESFTANAGPDDFEPKASELIEKLVKMKPRPRGIFVGNDQQLPTLYRLLRAKGIEPMKDIEIMGCDRHEVTLSVLDPKPATIDINAEEIGRRAVDQLLWRMKNPDESDGITLLVRSRLVLPEELKQTPMLESGDSWAV